MELIKLKDLACFCQKSKIKAGEGLENGAYPFFTSSDSQTLFLNSYLFDCEAVILGTGGKPSCNYYNGKFAVSTDNFVLTFKNKILAKYVYYFLRCNDMSILENGFHGAGLKHISKEYVGEILIPVIDITEQTQIVAELDNLISNIESNNLNIVYMDELIKSRFVEMFDRDIQNTKMNILDDYCEFVTVGIANSAVHAFCNDGVIMFRNQNIRENYLDTNDIIHITEDFANKYKSKALKENDILAVRTGYPGVSCVVPKEYEGCQTFTTLIARLNDTSAVNPHYLCYFINSKYGKEYVKGNTVGAAQQNFGATAFAKMPVYIPSIDKQLEFVEFSKRIDKSKFIIQKQINYLQELLNSKMNEYFDNN